MKILLRWNISSIQKPKTRYNSWAE